jgi:hypothetical protein
MYHNCRISCFQMKILSLIAVSEEEEEEGEEANVEEDEKAEQVILRVIK